MYASFCGNHASIASTHEVDTGVGAVVVVATPTVVVVELSGGQSSTSFAVGDTTLTMANAGRAAIINVRP
jgi:hypothetical protein